MIVGVVQGTQSVIHHPEAPAAVEIGHLPKLFAHWFIIFGLRLIADYGWVGTYQFADLSKTDGMLLL